MKKTYRLSEKAFQLDGKMPLSQAIPLGLQHVLAMFVGNLTPLLIITGPFGAKSIGEIVINTPGPAIAHAIYRATGVWHRELPITPEQIAMSVMEV